MASLMELVKLNAEGDLSRMLAKRFAGERGHLYPRADSEVMIGFGSRAETPSAEDIGKAVTEHYRKLGYQIEPSTHQSANSFSCLVFFDKITEGCTSVHISTFYPLVLGDEHNHLRMTTEVIF